MSMGAPRARSDPRVRVRGRGVSLRTSLVDLVVVPRGSGNGSAGTNGNGRSESENSREPADPEKLPPICRGSSVAPLVMDKTVARRLIFILLLGSGELIRTTSAIRSTQEGQFIHSAALSAHGASSSQGRC